MDQDFHYYGTYYAAMTGGYSKEDATLIAKASNFIDFLNNENYAGYWKMVRDTEKRSDQNYQVAAEVDYPRYSFQGNISVGFNTGSGGLWASFHFLPGNQKLPSGTPSITDIHGKDVAEKLPEHKVRDIKPDSMTSWTKITPEIGQLLNRPLSALSRALIKDTIDCLNDPKRLESILIKAQGGAILTHEDDKDPQKKQDVLKRFGLVLLGARAHVIADTWAHQDWCGDDNVINTYWDIDNSFFNNKAYQQIEYQNNGKDWKKVHLSSTSSKYFDGNQNLEAAPNITAYVGHGWMGHLPDYSFIKYRYRPCWQPASAEPLVRDNPTEYKYAFLELCSLFSQAKDEKQKFQPEKAENAKKITAAGNAISSTVDIADKTTCPRQHSANKWLEEMRKIGVKDPTVTIDTKQEPDSATVLDGQIDYIKQTLDPLGKTRYGTYYVKLTSDLYLFQIAVDYHFHFVKNWLKTNKIGSNNLFEDGWSVQEGPLDNNDILEVFAPKSNATAFQQKRYQ